MNCWHCGTELIWGGDADMEKDDSEDYDMETNLSCPNCGSFVLVYRKRGEKSLEIPSPTPDAPWLDDAIDRVDPKKLES